MLARSLRPEMLVIALVSCRHDEEKGHVTELKRHLHGSRGVCIGSILTARNKDIVAPWHTCNSPLWQRILPGGCS